MSKLVISANSCLKLQRLFNLFRYIFSTIMAPWWLLSRSFLVQTGARFVLTPMQITIKRFAEQNQSFRSVAASIGQKYNKIQVTHRFRKNNLTKTPEQIEQAARISEQRAIVICAEFLSSLIGTTIGLGLAIWAAYRSFIFIFII